MLLVLAQKELKVFWINYNHLAVYLGSVGRERDQGSPWLKLREARTQNWKDLYELVKIPRL